MVDQLSRMVYESAKSVGAVRVAEHTQQIGRLIHQQAPAANLQTQIELLHYSMRLVSYGVQQAGIDSAASEPSTALP